MAMHEPCIGSIPQLAFGLYKIDNAETILEAIRVGYRHFDAASVYGNEQLLGEALQKCGVPRSEFFIIGKVWNDAVKEKRVRESVEQSLKDIGCGYFDAFLVHWPVPGHFIEAYRVLEEMHQEGTLKAIGFSNFSPKDYEELEQAGIRVQPALNQIELSPFMYRPDYVGYFQKKNITVMAHKALSRASALDNPILMQIANDLSVSPAQVMIRWGIQKNCVITVKSSNVERMKQNRKVFDLVLDEDTMAKLDALTKRKDIEERNDLEEQRKSSQ